MFVTVITDGDRRAETVACARLNELCKLIFLTHTMANTRSRSKKNRVGLCTLYMKRVTDVPIYKYRAQMYARSAWARSKLNIIYVPLSLRRYFHVWHNNIAVYLRWRQSS